uniref:Sulfotransferase family protein n=1 Tax=Candidatus Kentrum sp. FW TaxID=2126338 RepID=A0A450TK64_9GAMM|nr:MAG: hypothetical protein BECKFW1821C_GA0114237_101321 [Candidatus Kentron sp. FW]
MSRTRHPLDNTDKPVSRTVILVLGMHRSGTSAITRVVNFLGAKLADELMPPQPDNNETGFWESAAVVQLNEDILQSGGSRWDDWLRFNPEWFRSPVVDEFTGRALDILARDVGQTGFFALKDPRICRLLPFWMNVFRHFGAQVKYVLPIRNPLEVAASLRARDGFGLSKSTLLWLRHVLEAEAATRDLPRVFVGYGELLSDWRLTIHRIADTLDLEWPRFSAEAEREIDAFLDAGHRHHRVSDELPMDHPDLSEWVKTAHGALLGLCREDGQQGLLEQLEEVREQFDLACKNLGVALHDEHTTLAKKAGNLEDRLSDCQLRLTEAESANREWERRIAALEAKHAESREEMEHALHEQKEATDRAAEKHNRELARQAEKTRGAEHARDEYKAGRDEVSKKLDARIQELVRFTRILQEKDEEVEATWKQLGKAVMALLDYSPGEPLTRRRQKRLVARIQESGIIDEQWYLGKYPDAAETGMDPSLHYLMYGALEGREPKDASRKVVQSLDHG